MLNGIRVMNLCWLWTNMNVMFEFLIFYELVFYGFDFLMFNFFFNIFIKLFKFGFLVRF